MARSGRHFKQAPAKPTAEMRIVMIPLVIKSAGPETISLPVTKFKLRDST